MIFDPDPRGVRTERLRMLGLFVPLRLDRCSSGQRDQTMQERGVGVDPFSAAFGIPRAPGSARPAAAAPRFTTPAVVLPAQVQDLDEALLDLLVQSGLFDAEFYRRRYRDIPKGISPAQHFLAIGAKEGRWPNPHFDPDWYRANQLVGPWAPHPILHYFQVGERQGLRPVSYFDPHWYSERYLGAFEDISALGHYLRSRGAGRFDPCPLFDTQYYANENPEVAAAGFDPFEHFLEAGHREGRNPSPTFDLRYYRRRFMNGADTNPLLHYLEIGMRQGNDPDPAAEVSVGSEVRRFARRAPEFEDFDPDIVGDREKLARLIAFYLPQFHAFPENDDWWGKGFTEWTNLSRGNPRFVGHYQPRVPRDLGFYDLKDASVMRAQIEMARAGGLAGFCFYYYNFNGKRLLHAPVEQFLAGDADWPFCIMWANENWSRRWDGSESQILIHQDYRAEDEAALVADLARHFADPRYIRLGGRPLFFVYRPGIIPRARETIAGWRRAFLERHGLEPLFFLAQTFEDHDPVVFGFDGAIEFPPHKILAKVHQINPKLEFLDHGFSGHVYQYEDVIKASAAVPAPEFPLIKTVFPSWDNDARRQGHGVVATGSTPTKYRRWLEGAIGFARRHRVEGEALVFINAWNEWAEGAYLEPDIHFGSAYLNATARTVVGERTDAHGYPLLVVVSSSAPAATLVAAHEFAAAAAREFGCDVHTLRIDRGNRARDDLPFAKPTLTKFDLLPAAIGRFREMGVVGAVVFGASAGDAVAPLRNAGLTTVSVMTEMPLSIAARSEDDLATALVRLSDVVVAPSASVLTAMTRKYGPATGRQIVRARIGRRVAIEGTHARAKAALALGLPPGTRLIVNVGPANLQSGADLFAIVAGIVTAGRDDVAFVWFGDLDSSLRAWLEPGESGSRLQFRPDAFLSTDPLSVAELLAFTAREDADALPVVAAVASGVAVASFEGSGAAHDILAALPGHGLVAHGDVGALADEIAGRLDRGRGLVRPPASPLPSGGGPEASAFALVQEADPSVLPVSVVVLHRRADGAAGPRLAAILLQTRPVAEIVVLGDDLEPAQREDFRAAAERSGRSVRIVDDEFGGLSLTQQLGRAAAAATYDFAWIVPPGAFHPDFLGVLSKPLAAQDTVAAICLPPQRGLPSPVLAGLRAAADLAADQYIADAVLTAGAILWRRRSLLAALNTLGPTADDRPGAILRHLAVHSGGPVFVSHLALAAPPAAAVPGAVAPALAVVPAPAAALVATGKARNRKAPKPEAATPAARPSQRQRRR